MKKKLIIIFALCASVLLLIGSFTLDASSSGKCTGKKDLIEVIQIDYSSMPCATNGVLYWPESVREANK